tara:strand:+ start:560 stop:1123 length:564 start_codon:yes stop_codon:yes gene_type:complete
MAVKFSEFATATATDTNTRLVGFDGASGSEANKQLSLNLTGIYSTDGALLAARTVTTGAFDLDFASSTAGQQVKFGQNIKIEGQGYTELNAQATNDLQFNWNNGNVQSTTGLNGIHTFTASNPRVGATYIITLAQSGAVTATWTGVSWPGGTVPTLSGASKTDVITLICYNANSSGLYYGVATLDFS